MTNRPRKKRPDNTWRKEELRHGYTTSACAAACAAAGVKTLISGEAQGEVVIDLPGEKDVSFKIMHFSYSDGGVLCGTLKDSGDDPDITNGAEIQAWTTWQEKKEITIRGGLGVGLVTKPGLVVEVGKAAINPGPQRLIERVIRAAAGDELKKHGVLVEIRVPDGEKLARETLNPRLGIVGGISILGNSGVLKPFSNSAYKASIYTELKVAATNGVERAVLSTGSRSEKYAMQQYPQLPEMAFIQAGDHIGFALKHAVRLGVREIVISGMIGKISKLAQGRMQTHVSEGLVDFEFLVALAEELGADKDVLEKVSQANTAYHVKNILDQAGVIGLEKKLAELAARHCFDYARDLEELVLFFFSIKGELREKIIIRRVE